MNVRDAEGKTIMDRLIAKLPDAAMVTLLSLSLSLSVSVLFLLTDAARKSKTPKFWNTREISLLLRMA